MHIGVKAFIDETCWIGGVGTLIVMIGFGFGVENVVTSGTLFVAFSFISLGCQKKESSGSIFRGRDFSDAVIFVEEVTSYVFSDSGSQKKERSEMSFVHGFTGDEMNFLGGAIQSETTC